MCALESRMLLVLNVKYISKSLCTSRNSALVIGVLLKASHMVRIFVT